VREVGIVDNNFALWQDWKAIEFLVNISSCCEVIVQAPAAGRADLVQEQVRSGIRSYIHHAYNTSYMHIVSYLNSELARLILLNMNH
jgi:hypothetical protein